MRCSRGKAFQAEETNSAKELSLLGGFEEYLGGLCDWKGVNETDSSERLKDFEKKSDGLPKPSLI